MKGCQMNLRSNFPKMFIYSSKLNQFLCYMDFSRYWLNWGSYTTSICSSKCPTYKNSKEKKISISFGFKISVVSSDSRLLAINVLHEKRREKKREKRKKKFRLRPGIEPRTFRVWAFAANHYTTVPLIQSWVNASNLSSFTELQCSSSLLSGVF